MTADKRLSDDRVKVAAKRHWLVGADAPSILDVLDVRPTVDDTSNPPSRPVRAVPLPHIGEHVLPDVRRDYSRIFATDGMGRAGCAGGGVGVHSRVAVVLGGGGLVIDPSLQNALNTDALLMQALNAPSRLPASYRKTGQPGLMRVLPEGWATVTVWPLPGADEFGAECEHWSGPVLHESETVIRIGMGDTGMGWLKSDRITVKYGAGAAA